MVDVAQDRLEGAQAYLALVLAPHGALDRTDFADVRFLLAFFSASIFVTLIAVAAAVL